MAQRPAPFVSNLRSLHSDGAWTFRLGLASPTLTSITASTPLPAPKRCSTFGCPGPPPRISNIAVWPASRYVSRG